MPRQTEPTPDERERARRVLAAVRALPPGALELVADHAVGPNAEQLARVRDAIAAPDPEAALAEVLRGTTIADASTLDPIALFATGRQLAAAADELRGELLGVEAGRRDLVAEGHRALAGAADPALAALLTDALAVLGEDGPFVALREAVAAAGGAGELIAAVERGDIDARGGARVAELRAHRDAIAGAAAQIAAIPALLTRAGAYATDRGDHRAAARLALAVATLTDDGWPEVLALLIAAELLGDARAVATRVEARALAAGRLDQVAATAAQIAELAARLGDADAELAAVCDQALALCHLPDPATPVLALVARAHALGADAAPRAVRALLLEGQATELLDDLPTARRAFRSLMTAASREKMHHELGWGALHLGRLEAAQGHAFQASQNLDLAVDVGRTLGDSVLFGLACAARIETAADRAAAAAVLAQAQIAAPTMRAELQRRFESRWP